MIRKNKAFVNENGRAEAHNHAQTLQWMEEELKLAGYSPRTVSSYL